MTLDELIELIGKFEAPNVFNPWQRSDPLDVSDPPHYSVHDRRQRLWRHFNCIPHYLLIGEAPGYQGCHFSGVPFTNEALLMQGAIPRMPEPKRITSRPKPWSEPSATIVWRTLHELKIASDVVMWNAFGWHPHKPGEPMSNRAPTKQELASGAHVLRAVVEHFRGAKVIAVGRVAEAILRRLEVRTNGSVRHPSMGGATDFRNGLRSLISGDSTP